MPTEAELLKALGQVMDPELGKDLVSLGMIKDLAVDEAGHVSLTLELTTAACPLRQKLQDDVRAAVQGVKGVCDVSVNVTSRARGGAGGCGHAHGEPSSAATAERAPLVPGAKQIIAVGAGKGGVGKSTVSVYLALALKRAGATVGLLDADIYGPSVPRMLGVRDQRPEVVGGKLQPIAACGLRVMSVGFLVDPQTALAWRGPMIHRALEQLFSDVLWGDLDYLVIDLPPGTGDIQISLAQLVPVTGAVIVSTPPQVALQDAIKAVTLFRQTGIEILGMVENMSYFVCPRCGEQTELFGRYTVGKTAMELGVPYLGDLPMNLHITEAGDAGDPETVLNSSDDIRKIIDGLAERLKAEIAVRMQTKPPPSTVAARK